MTKRPNHIVAVDNGIAELLNSFTQLPNFAGGKCVGADPDLFFPDTMAQARQAIALCNSCPLIEQCLQWALVHEDHGIWGGKTARQRARMRNGVKAVNPVDAVKGAEWAAAVAGNEPARVLAERYSVSERTVFRWRKEFKHGKDVG